jgi:hypothetical protein
MGTLKNVAMALALPGVLAVSAPAAAAVPSHAALTTASFAAGQVWQHGRDRHDRYYGERRGRRSYEEPVYRNTRVWRGDDGRYYCRKKNGTTGLLIGGAAGALIGREIAGGGDRTLGAIVGAAGGALLGREIDRGGSRCR